jgi:regulatory protein
MRRALRRKGFARRQIEAAIERLRKARYLDDSVFAEQFARSRISYRGHGRNRIRADLRSRGVASGTAETALARALEDVSETEALDALARKYWRQRNRDEPGRRMRKLWAFLLRRGYPASLVGERLRALWPRWGHSIENLEAPEGSDSP